MSHRDPRDCRQCWAHRCEPGPHGCPCPEARRCERSRVALLCRPGAMHDLERRARSERRHGSGSPLGAAALECHCSRRAQWICRPPARRLWSLPRDASLPQGPDYCPCPPPLQHFRRDAGVASAPAALCHPRHQCRNEPLACGGECFHGDRPSPRPLQHVFLVEQGATTVWGAPHHGDNITLLDAAYGRESAA